MLYNPQIHPVAESDDNEMVLDTEPDSSAWLRFKEWLLSPLVPEELL